MEVEHAANGRIAVEMYQPDTYDLIFMDVQMPEMNGHDATIAIRKQEQANGWNRTRIIALTAHAMTKDKDLCIEAGMDTYITKPIDVPSFIMFVREQLKKSNETK